MHSDMEMRAMRGAGCTRIALDEAKSSTTKRSRIIDKEAMMPCAYRQPSVMQFSSVVA